MLQTKQGAVYAVVVAAVLLSCLIEPSYCAQSVTLDDYYDYNVSWEYTDTRITFTVTVKTTGWVGFGLSPNGGMKNSDIVIVGVQDNANTISDRHTRDQAIEPAVDTEQDWTLHSRDVDNGVTTIVMSRPLIICRDNEQDMSITSDTLRLMYAYGSESQPWVQYHTSRRGTKSLYLLVAETSAVQDVPTDAEHIDMAVENLPIPVQSTTYWCTLFKLPKFEVKRQIISFEPIVTKGNEKFVHHILIYGCFHNISGDTYIDNNDHSHKCFGANMPDGLKPCRSILFAWAIGGGKFSYPSEGGYPLGVEGTPDFVLMEMHYDNPQLTTGKLDSSGIRLTHTANVRPNDVSVLEVGSVASILIPPGRKSMEITYMCPTSCTEEAIPDDGITIFAGMLHSHLLGRKIAVRHTKSDSTSAILLKDHSYDFNFQETRHLPMPIKINKGDMLQITCSMDSSALKVATYGGLSTTEEMCLGFLFYYPRIEMSRCTTIAPFQTGNSYPQIYEQLGITIANDSYFEETSEFRGVQWNETRGDQLQASFFEGNHLSHCLDLTTEVIKPFVASYKQIPGTLFSKDDNSAGECNNDETGSASSLIVTILVIVPAILATFL